MPKLICVGLSAWLAWFCAAAQPMPVLAPYAGNLVRVKDGKLAPANAAPVLQARYVVLYFGAGWCPDCRKFSPRLVAAYDHQPAVRRDFEVVFISQDHSEAEMRQFMVKEKMNWPALACDKVNNAQELTKYHPNKSIPWLAVINRSGKVVLESTSDEDAAEVLRRLEQRLATAKRP